MNGFAHLVLFNLDERRFALNMSAVERISRAVEITPLPKAPRDILGVINVQGRVVPVVDIRKRFNLPARDVKLSDHILIGKTSKRSIAILVDNVSDIIESSKRDIIEQDQILSDMEYIQGVVKLNDGILLVHDLEKLLTAEEEVALDQAIRKVDLKKGKERRKGNLKEKRPV